MQLMSRGILLVLMLHSVWPFLERIATEDALLGVLVFGLLAQL
ncbi:MAG: hypothetical protein Q4B28_07315 [bacterium]|nr:hypothetical protein [bacterium]